MNYAIPRTSTKIGSNNRIISPDTGSIFTTGVLGKFPEKTLLTFNILRGKRSQDRTRKQETRNGAVELSSVEVMRNTRWYICILF